MTDPRTLAILNRAFVRIYRSIGQYLRESSPEFDAGSESSLRELMDRQAADANDLGRFIFNQQGHVDLGAFPASFEDLQYLNMSRLLPDWKSAQERLVADLQTDRVAIADASDPGVAILDSIIAHEKDVMAELERVCVNAGAAV